MEISQKGKVLVIEDEEIWQIILRDALTDSGFYVDVVNNLDDAIKKIEDEIFHFITIDMNLMEIDLKELKPEFFEGWDILEVIKKLHIHDRTPTMIISAFVRNYETLKRSKKLESLFFMDKHDFDSGIFISIVEREVDRKDLRFNNDHRS